MALRSKVPFYADFGTLAPGRFACGHPDDFVCRPILRTRKVGKPTLQLWWPYLRGRLHKYVYKLNLFIDFAEESFRTGYETEVARTQFHRWKRGRVNQPPLAHSMVFCWDTISMNVKRHAFCSRMKRPSRCQCSGGSCQMIQQLFIFVIYIRPP